MLRFGLVIITHDTGAKAVSYSITFFVFVFEEILHDYQWLAP